MTTIEAATEILLLAVPVVIAITLHEAAHGFVARHFGDSTAADQGRVTLNPLKHIDPLGTIILPGLLLLSHAGFLFGYARPVPVNFANLGNPRRDMIWVAAAGPAMNAFLALLSALLLFPVLHLSTQPPDWAITALWGSVQINLVLAVFNLWPIPPLDGSKVIGGLLPAAAAKAWAQLDRFGMLLVLAIFLILPQLGLNVFEWMVGRPVAWIERPILSLLGVT